ncbi:MAG: antibiotic biosynthesis monooxygenase [Proteobacteria bacterium]|nr:antibiotic biosynthesis monooxygenase [Pseudomonadota bacterium]
MILVVAEAVVKQGCAEQFLKAAAPCIAGTRKEAENITYDLMVDTSNPCKFTFVEQWVKKESLDQHVQTEHFKTFAGAIQNLLAAELVINVYEAKKL